jgi:hypothetical protein
VVGYGGSDGAKMMKGRGRLTHPTTRRKNPSS